MSEYKFSIEANNVNKVYKNKKVENKALLNFSLKIPKGSIYGLLGPNGAGKSTFINILAGLVKKNSGKIHVAGMDIDINSKNIKKKIGIVPQELNIDPFFTPIELLELQAGLYGVRKTDRKSEEILSKVGLLNQKNAYARTLSGGMRRRLLVAKALVHDPEIIILDEPTAGVDINLRTQIWNYIKELNYIGKTICLTTHYLEEAEKLCDQITLINNGKLIKTDSKENLVNLFSDKKIIFILKNNEIKIPKELLEYNAIIKENNLIINYNASKYNLRFLISILEKNNIDFIDIKTEDGSLEKTFIRLINNV